MITTVGLHEVLLAGAREVFETMVFMGLEEVGSEEAGVSQPALLATITFKGPLEGCLGICCGAVCARAIAASMLGLDAGAELADSDICDAIGEIANMILGAIKARIQDSVGVIEVSIPSVVRGRELINSLGDGAEQTRVLVRLDEGSVAQLSLLSRNGRH